MCDESKAVYAVEPCGHLFCSGIPSILQIWCDSVHVLVMSCSWIVLPCICLSALHVDCSRRMKTCFECKAQVKVQCPSDSGMYKLFSTYCSCVLCCFYVNLQGIGVVRDELQDNSYLDRSAPHSSAQAPTPHATKRKGARVRRTQLGKH